MLVVPLYVILKVIFNITPRKIREERA